MRKYLIIIISILSFFFHSKLQGQNILNNNYSTDPNLNSLPTPQAEALGAYSRNQTALYNGKFDLSIPIFDLPVRGHLVDIKLDYLSGGIKPNDKGSCIGVGWSLIASGIITRIQRGIPDENVNYTYTDSLLGYYWNRSTLNRSTWNTISALDSLIYCIPCNGSPTGCNAGTPQWHDWAPDEFLFNFLGYSGSFWLDNTGSWQIRENSGEKMTISVTNGAYSYKYPTATNSMNLSHVFKNITITDGNGNIFVFGADANSIEFNRNMASSNSATATSWYLSSIVTSKGEKINYTYQRIYPSASEFGSMNCYLASYSSMYYNWNLQNVSGVLHDPVYLQQISFGKIAIQFKYMASNINYYCCNPLRPYVSTDTVPSSDITTYISNATNKLTEPANGGVVPLPTEYQLDTIQVSYGNFSRYFTLGYYTSGANRLFLKSLTQGNGPNNPSLTHQFLYNGTSFYVSSDSNWLVQDNILTTKVDHWGYYNGKLPFKTGDLPRSAGKFVIAGNNTNGFSYPNADFISTYYSNRQPNVDSAKVGSLSRIIYPTGGYTDFVYELNDYSSQISLSQFTDSAVFNGSNSYGGGLRIKQIISHPDSVNTPLVKQYRYLNDNGYSSGVLNTPGLLYQDSLIISMDHLHTVSFWYFYDNKQMPLLNQYTSPVAYSRVDEVNADSGRIVHRFLNYDNGNYDLLPSTNVAITKNSTYYQQASSLYFHRGNSYSTEMYDSSGAKVGRNLFTYLNDNSLVTSRTGVRAYDLKSKDIKSISYLAGNGGLFPEIFLYAAYWPMNASAYVNYLHDFPIVHSIDSVINGSNVVSTSDSIIYNSINNKIKTRIVSNLSDGSSKTEAITYPSDLSSSNSFYSGMVTQNVINPTIQRTLTDQTGKLLLVSKDSLVKKTVGSNNLYQLYRRQKYHVATDTVNSYIFKYDSVSNPVWAMGADSIPIAYKWDYSAIYPVSVTRNASDTNIAYTSFEAEGNGNWSVPDTIRDLSNYMTGIKSYDITNAKTISASVLSGKQFIASYWSKNGSLSVKANGSSVASSLTGLTKNGFTYYEHLLPATTTSVTVTGPSASSYPIDELRLYPVDAQMSTYTYAPLEGVTSKTSPAGLTTYYGYDSLGRLSYTADIDRNIISGHTYQFQQLTEPVTNDLEFAPFTKQGCGTGTIGSVVVDSVLAGTFSSYINKADANQQALNYIAANGQNNANTKGICLVAISGSAVTTGFIAKYTSVSTGLTTSFSIPSGSQVVLGGVAAGTYNISITKPSNVTNYYFQDGCSSGMFVHGTSASFTNISVSVSDCNIITITTNAP